MKKNLEIDIYDYLNMDIPFDCLAKPRTKKEKSDYELRETFELAEEYADENNTNPNSKIDPLVSEKATERVKEMMNKGVYVL